MDRLASNTHYNTPEVVVTDNRRLTIREIQYQRDPGMPDITNERITRHTFTSRGHAHTSADPRLGQSQINNFSYRTSLSGQPLLTTGVDSGTVLILSDAAGRPHLGINATGVTRRWQYENADSAGRLLAISEREENTPARITERFVYAGNSTEERGLNLTGQRIRHYDTAGLVRKESMALTAVPLQVTRRLLKEADNPATLADWQGENAAAWDNLLDADTWTTLTKADAVGAMLTRTDAKGNVQRVAYDVEGLLKGSWLRLNDDAEQVIVKSLSYSAAGQKLREEHGNGLVTTYSYEAQTQRLMGIETERPVGHTSGVKVLQDLRYQYDPVGNVLSVRNDAEATRFWRNQKVVPENILTYDSRYQLVSATGREMANAGQQKTHLPLLSFFDNATYTNYTRTYVYDSGGNLTQLRHSAPETNNCYTTDITVSNRSNRAVLRSLADTPEIVDSLFTAGGHQKLLLPGQTLQWTPRGELGQVSRVNRDDLMPDNEHYRYDSASQRVSKISTQQTGNCTQMQQTLYLAGLELRTLTSGISTKEVLHTVTVGEASQARVRVLHWESGKPDDISNNQVRYSYDNLTGSSVLEVDAVGNIISQEEYYAYGGTAILTARSELEVAYKTYRYSGKERDATGLYCYGYRYYQPWAGRWLSTDPAGTVDGLNLFRMVRNNPVTLRDVGGLMPTRAKKETARKSKKPVPNPSQPVAGSSRAITISKNTNDGEVYSEKIRKLQSKQEYFEEAVREFAACDVKAQAVLRLIRKEHDLWEAFHDKLEVRVIKEKDEGDGIVLHPKGEKEERWVGKYHVYVTIRHEGKRLVLDPYIGGKNSFAHIEEREFIQLNWKGKEGRDYELETIAPAEGSDSDDACVPEFSLEDYMNDLFDPGTFESHKYYYY